MVPCNGPAGAACALLLARGGMQVLLVDRCPFPRDKACGDLLIPDSLAILAVERKAPTAVAVRAYVRVPRGPEELLISFDRSIVPGYGSGR